MKYILVLLLSVSCASIKQLDTSLEPKGTTNEGGVVGLKDGEAVIMKKTAADDELRVVQWKNFQLENDLNHEYHMTKWCYEDLSDPRLGGNGELSSMPPMNTIKKAVEVKEELGLEGEKLIVLKQSSFKEQLQVEKDYTKSLSLMIAEVKQTKQECERKMGVARVKAGLPSKRQKGEVKFSPNGVVEEVLKIQEKSLDDAFKTKQDMAVGERNIASEKEEPEEQEVATPEEVVPQEKATNPVSE